MTQTPPVSPGPDAPTAPGLYFHVHPTTGVVSVAIREPDGHLAVTTVPAERLGGLSVALLRNAHDEAVRMSHTSSPITSYQGESVPIGQLALLEGDGATRLLVFGIGRAHVGFRLPIEQLREIGATLLAASATTETKN